MIKDEKRFIPNKTIAATIRITEPKLDHTVLDSEVSLSEYDILWGDRKRNSGDVACYIRKDLCFNTKTLHCKERGNVVFYVILRKSKSR